MEIQPTSFAALTWLGAAAGADAEGWRLGAVMSAKPLGINDQGLMVMQIGALTVETDPPPNQQLPAQFQVRVLTLGAQPQLEILGVGTPAPPAPVVSQALLERLPQQNGYAPLLATLAALSQWPLQRQLPPAIRTALALLEHSIGTPEELATPDGLKQAIERSGLFLESRLAQAGSNPAAGSSAGSSASALLNSALSSAGLASAARLLALPLETPETTGKQPPIQEDWKAALLRLAALLRGQPQWSEPAGNVEPPLAERGLSAQARGLLPEALALSADADDFLPRLRNDVTAALARLEVAQLEATRLPAWVIELPVQGRRGSDVLQLKLEQHQQAAGDVEAAHDYWTLGFALDLPTLGPLQGELVLRGLHVSVRLWAALGHASALLESQFDSLREQLAGSGLTLDQLTCQTGLPQAGHDRSAVFLNTTA